MSRTILLSTAYLPPVEYFARMRGCEDVRIEREENYKKQTFRNRCYILASDGRQLLTVPVFLGSFHKTSIKDIRIDYSKRWQQVHRGALISSYNASPFFIHYFEILEKIIFKNHKFLLDLNMELLEAILGFLKLDVRISYTSMFSPEDHNINDLRYKINPKKDSGYKPGEYIQVFSHAESFIPGLSIVDLLFNTGPDAVNRL